MGGAGERGEGRGVSVYTSVAGEGGGGLTLNRDNPGGKELEEK